MPHRFARAGTTVQLVRNSQRNSNAHVEHTVMSQEYRMRANAFRVPGNIIATKKDSRGTLNCAVLVSLTLVLASSSLRAIES